MKGHQKAFTPSRVMPLGSCVFSLKKSTKSRGRFFNLELPFLDQLTKVKLMISLVEKTGDKNWYPITIFVKNFFMEITYNFNLSTFYYSLNSDVP